MDMLQAGHCDIKDIEKKISQDSDTTMFEGKIPPQKQVAFIGVCLLRKRRIILL